jgi:23S rRNA (guanosine2251-2'-O)-methyltransferase
MAWMSGSEKTYPVLCPSERCGELFDVPRQRLGRNMYCPACGVRLTARPLEIEPRLRARQRQVRGGEGAPTVRLPLIVLVDNVRSLWNVGSIFRSADACGVERIVLSGISGCPPQPRIAKTALGAEESVAWSYGADTLEALADPVERGYVPVALEMSERAVSIEDFDWPPRVCLVVGNEVAGVTPQVLDVCPHHVTIPMLGMKRSFNVAVAFGIAAYRAAHALARRAADSHAEMQCPS